MRQSCHFYFRVIPVSSIGHQVFASQNRHHNQSRTASRSLSAISVRPLWPLVAITALESERERYGSPFKMRSYIPRYVRDTNILRLPKVSKK